jgi:hypothetical protein
LRNRGRRLKSFSLNSLLSIIQSPSQEALCASKAYRQRR